MDDDRPFRRKEVLIGLALFCVLLGVCMTLSWLIGGFPPGGGWESSDPGAPGS